MKKTIAAETEAENNILNISLNGSLNFKCFFKWVKLRIKKMTQERKYDTASPVAENKFTKIRAETKYNKNVNGSMAL